MRRHGGGQVPERKPVVEGSRGKSEVNNGEMVGATAIEAYLTSVIVDGVGALRDKTSDVGQ